MSDRIDHGPTMRGQRDELAALLLELMADGGGGSIARADLIAEWIRRHPHTRALRGGSSRGTQAGRIVRGGVAALEKLGIVRRDGAVVRVVRPEALRKFAERSAA